MASNGKYVRAKDEAHSSDGEAAPEANTDCFDETNSDRGSECYGKRYGSGSDSESQDSDSDDSSDDCSSAYSTGSVHSPSEDESASTTKHKETASENTESEPKQVAKQQGENSGTSDRMQQIEKVLADLTNVIGRFKSGSPQPTNRERDESWDFSRESPKAQCSYPSIRPEHIKPFPNGIRPNKMWAEWFDFIENFELGMSLYNAHDPVYKSKMLHIYIGQELRAIVNAANLRPSLKDASCYTSYVRNIENHLRSMTDTAAEHQAFLRMKQEKDESTVAFHARLVRNVKLCGYSSSDQSRFVRAQLLDGLRNKELVKAARTYGYDTSFIVQSSTREEAYEAETEDQAVDSNIFEVYQGRTQGLKRINPRQWSGHPNAKVRRTDTDFPRMQEHQRSSAPDRGHSFRQQSRDNRPNPRQGRRPRCPQCNNTFHRNPQCPALTRRCDNCGQRGHFAVACPTARLRTVQQNARYSDAESSSGEVYLDSKQVKQM